MDWIPIDWHNPLILLRVYLAALWGVSAVYGAWVVRSIRPAIRPLGWYSIFASLAGAVSYFLGAATVFRSVQGFLWVALMLTFTPIALLAWLHIAKHMEQQ